MSTKVTLAQENVEPVEWVKCKVCDVSFVPGGVRIRLPERCCIWCFTRGHGTVWRRYKALYDALMEATEDHPENCQEKCCRIAKIASSIMNS